MVVVLTLGLSARRWFSAFAEAALVALRTPLGPQSLQSSCQGPWWMRPEVELIRTVSRVQRFDPCVGPAEMEPVPWVAKTANSRRVGPGVVIGAVLSAVTPLWVLVESASIGAVVSTPCTVKSPGQASGKCESRRSRSTWS